MPTAAAIRDAYSVGCLRYLNKPWAFNAMRYVFGCGTSAIDQFAATPPTTPATCDRNTAGAINYQSGVGASDDWYLTGVRAISDANPTATVQMWDRLAHQGGLSGTVTTAQTTNLPLTLPARETGRAIPYVGVQLALVVYSAVGTTPTTVTVSYTNQDGTAGRTSIATLFGGATGNERPNAGQMIPIPLQAGDSGVQSVESVTVAASTGTAGSFGVVLLRPLAMLALVNGGSCWGSAQIYGPRWGGLCRPIPQDACLWLSAYGMISSTSGAYTFEFLELP